MLSSGHLATLGTTKAYMYTTQTKDVNAVVSENSDCNSALVIVPHGCHYFSSSRRLDLQRGRTMVNVLKSVLNIILLEHVCDRKNQNFYIPHGDWKFLRVSKHEARGAEIISQAVSSVGGMAIIWDHTLLLDPHQHQNLQNNFDQLSLTETLRRLKASFWHYYLCDGLGNQYEVWLADGCRVKLLPFTVYNFRPHLFPHKTSSIGLHAWMS